MNERNKKIVTKNRRVKILNVTGGATMKVLKCMLRGLALFLAMNDKVGYAMRDGD